MTPARMIPALALAVLPLTGCLDDDARIWQKLAQSPGQEVRVGAETYRVVVDGGTYVIAHVGFSSVPAEVLQRDAATAVARMLGCRAAEAEVRETQQGRYAVSEGCTPS